MQTSLKYLEASFISFLIHAAFILYLLGFFYFENSKRSVISKPINVNLIFESPNIESNIKKSNVNKIVESPVESLNCLLYTSPSPRDKRQSRMPSSA